MQRKKLDFAEELTYIEELYQRRAFIEAADCLTDMLSQPAVYSRWGAVLLLPDLEEGATVALPRIDALIADPATPELVRQDAVTAKELIIVRLRQRKLIPEAAETKPGQTSEL